MLSKLNRRYKQWFSAEQWIFSAKRSIILEIEKSKKKSNNVRIHQTQINVMANEWNRAIFFLSLQFELITRDDLAHYSQARWDSVCKSRWLSNSRDIKIRMCLHNVHVTFIRPPHQLFINFKITEKKKFISIDNISPDMPM